MKMGTRLLDGPGTPSLVSVQDLRLMALLKDLVKDMGQVEAAEVLGIDRKTVWRSLGAGRLSPRLADALERLLLSGGGSVAAQQRAEMDALTRRIDGLEREMRSSLRAMEGGIEALREEHVENTRGIQRRLGQMEAGRDPQSEQETPSPVRRPPRMVELRRQYPELATIEPAPDDEDVFGKAWPLIVEWRKLRGNRPNWGKGLAWLAAQERLMEVELALLEEHGLTLPPEKQPLHGLDRGAQVNWRRTALYDTQRARAKAVLLRWVRRILTFNLWRR